MAVSCCIDWALISTDSGLESAAVFSTVFYHAFADEWYWGHAGYCHRSISCEQSRSLAIALGQYLSGYQFTLRIHCRRCGHIMVARSAAMAKYLSVACGSGLS